MSRRSKRRREVELFNFSFLDILACVIGLLIFILSIVVVSAGGSSNRQTAGRLSNAEHLLQQSHEAVQRESERRSRAEQMLASQARDFTDPQAAASAVRGEISLLNDESSRLENAAITAHAKVDSLHQALQAMDQTPTVDPAAAAIQEELRRLDQETAELRNRAAQERQKAALNVRQVQFYVPHVREVNRRTLWVEVSNDRIWCLASDDYVATPVDEDSTTFARVAGAAGTCVSAMAAGKADVPFTLASAVPQITVVEVAVHPDGFEAFRKLRQWAWDRGFSVNWVPQDENPITLTRTTHVMEQ